MVVLRGLLVGQDEAWCCGVCVWWAGDAESLAFGALSVRWRLARRRLQLVLLLWRLRWALPLPLPVPFPRSVTLPLPLMVEVKTFLFAWQRRRWQFIVASNRWHRQLVVGHSVHLGVYFKYPYS